ncbi:hypothetical protein FDB29_07280 [Clostridium botulinum]|nr:hypothetical protein [Clostridium botulinum]HBJ2622089.1 hypothetical protein [Clostridium botulinum]
MENKKLFTVYIGKELGEVDLNINVNLNVEGLIPKEKINEMLTQIELKQLESITLNICKRINKVNGDNELKIPNIIE